MSERRLHFEAAVPQEQLRQRRRRRGLSGLVALAALVLVAWNVSGISIAPGRLQYSAVGIGTGGEVRPVVLTNRNSSDVHPRVQVLGEAASDFSFSSEACATIKGGEACRLPVHFRPHESGLKSAQLTVTLDDGQSVSAELVGEALPAVEFLPQALDFQQVVVGIRSGEQQVRLSGPEDLRIATASIQGEGSPDYHIEQPACTANPGTGTECYISVSLRPRHEGETRANLVVRLEGHPESYAAALRGEGIPAIHPVPVPTPIPVPTTTATPAPPPSVTPPVQPVPRAIMRVAPLEMDFSAGPRRPQQVHVWNDGDAPLHVDALIAGPDTPRFRVPTQPCSEIPPHGDCVIPVRFQPARGKPEYVAVLRLNHSADNIGSPQEVVLHWKSRQQPTPPNPEEQGVTVNVQPGSLNFSGETNGRTAVSLPSQTITIRNSGPGNVQNLNLRLGMFGGGNNKYFRHSSNCRTLAPGEACQETVSFTAVAATGYQEKLYVMDGLLKVLAVVQLSATLSGRTPQPNRTPATDTLDIYRPPGPGPSIYRTAPPTSPTPQQVQRIRSIRRGMIRTTPTPTPTPTPDIHMTAPALPTPAAQIQRIQSIRKIVRLTPTPTPTPTPDLR